MEKPKFAVILAGCGSLDGSEIHESVLTLLAIIKNGGEYEIFAPNSNQYHVINHYTREVMNETRNMLVEAARIARGNIKPIEQLNAEQFDALIIPGGYGVAKNLCSYAFDSINMKVLPSIEETIRKMITLKKPIGALCIAPVILAKLLPEVKLTIGNDVATAEIINKLGGNHKPANFNEAVVDEKYKVVTSPCYMVATDVYQIAQSTESMVKAMMQLL